MKEILISAEDEKVDMIIKNIKKLGAEVKSVDEVISFDEAKRRVSEAVEEYRSGKMKTYSEEEFEEIMQNYWAKYEN